MDRYNIEIIPIPLPSDSYTIFTSMTSTLDPTPTSSSVMPSSSIDYCECGPVLCFFEKLTSVIVVNWSCYCIRGAGWAVCVGVKLQAPV